MRPLVRRRRAWWEGPVTAVIIAVAVALAAFVLCAVAGLLLFGFNYFMQGIFG